ncbi:uncharacterized protein LOC128249852 isoform X2 [Octopus bimaculoides]|nr:uncharacterized protein LOC128249852 isoform X2 [Octopus bimaculoides]
MSMTRVTTMKYSLCILLLVHAAISEFCEDTAKEFCDDVMKRYPIQKKDKYYCNRIKLFKDCFKGTFKECADFFASTFKNKKCAQTIAKQNAPSSTRLESLRILLLLLIISVLL